MRTVNSDAPPLNPRYKEAAAPAAGSALRIADGGPRGRVKKSHGIMVQLISDDRDPATATVQPKRWAVRIS